MRKKQAKLWLEVSKKVLCGFFFFFLSRSQVHSKNANTVAVMFSITSRT